MDAVDIPTSDIYSDYAAAYDRSGQLRFAVLMNVYLEDVLRRHVPPNMRMLDLACGTGTLAILRAEAGWDVTGLDRSAAMLHEARRKSYSTDARVRFVEGDIRSFALDAPVGLITCCYDSLNYLLDDGDLLACFRATHRALVEDGMFCFDLATEYFLREYWRGTETYQDQGYQQVMHSSYDEERRLSTLVLDGTVWREDGTVHRFREIHVERPYARASVERLLAQAGFVCEAWYDCFTFEASTERSLRYFVVARKPAASSEA
jgi:SAM-dependent methyltransferase